MQSRRGELIHYASFYWTEEQAVDGYMYHAEIQYALNLEPSKQSLSLRTLQRYEKIFRENDLAERVLHQVTCKLIRELDLDVSRQRLDSTRPTSRAIWRGSAGRASWRWRSKGSSRS